MRSFCEDPFFDPNVTWHTDDPNLTECMRDTLMMGVPCGSFALVSLAWIVYVHQRSQGSSVPLRRDIGWIFVAKIGLTVVLLINLGGQLQQELALMGGASNLYGSKVLYFSSLAGAYILVLLHLAFYKVMGERQSLPLFVFWFLLSLAQIPQLRYDLEMATGTNGKWAEWVLIASGYPVILAQFVLHCFKECPNEVDERSPPEYHASYLSILTFSWMNGVMLQGYRNPLLVNQLPEPPGSVDVKSNVVAFGNRWNAKTAHRGISFEDHAQGRKFIPVWSVLWSCHWRRILLAFLLGLIHYSSSFISPQLLNLLVKHVSSEDEEVWKGYLYTALLFLGSLFWTLTFHVYCQNNTIMSIQMRSSMIGAIYRKSLRLSNMSRRKFTLGEITNYMSVDAQRIVETFPSLTFLFSSPFTIIVANYFLYQELGPSSFVGSGILMLLIPINIITGKWAERLQEDQLKNKDERIKLMTEILTGIKVLKLYAWENPFMKRILDIRNSEIRILKLCARLWGLMNFTYSCSPIFVTVSVFALYVSIDPSHVLTANKIFVSMALLNMTRLPLVMFPWSFVEGIKLLVSLKRINRFLNADEIKGSNVLHEVQDPSNAIEISDGHLTWDDLSSPCLQEITLDISKGSLTAIVGVVGSGKSSLLSAILGEMDVISGCIRTGGSMAYVPQQAWIQNMTLRDNIVFQNAFVEAQYEHVLEVCQLRPDLDILKSGDMTEIGENGINLSGGQKQRVSLARAIYTDSDVYLLDDPLSAVDAHVGKAIFEGIVSNERGCLKDKTRILVTHNVNYLSRMDDIVVMKAGSIVERGSYNKLVADGGAFSEFLKQYSNPGEAKRPRRVTSQRSSSLSHHMGSIERTTSNAIAHGIPLAPRTRQISMASSIEDAVNEVRSLLAEDGHVFDVSADLAESEELGLLEDTQLDEAPSQAQSRLVVDEESSTGAVNWSVYLTYINGIGYVKFLLVVALYVCSQVIHTSSNYWLSLWADENQAHPDAAQDNVFKFMGTYSGLGGVEVVMEFGYEFILFYICTRASKVIHDDLLGVVMQSPMAFFDTNPTGRIINRFSADVDSMDQKIPFSIGDFIWCFGDVFSIMFIICISTPMFIAVIVPLGIVFFFIQRFYIATSRQLKRLESVSKSPIFSHFSETVSGVTSIRAFQQQDRFIRESEERVVTNVKCYYLKESSNRWLGVRVEMIGNLVVLFAALFVVIQRGSLSPGLAGLSIAYALNIMDSLNWMIRMVCELETNFVALERILEYTHNPPEAPWYVNETDDELPPSWPGEGELTFQSYACRYRPGLDLVLKGVNLQIEGKAKVGICGRTGAGKSSLTQSLFRLIEAASGKICLDGVDISRLGLHKLRKAITIIPQDPVLFTGNLRFNLDPSHFYGDDEIWSALEHAHLKEHIATLEQGLNHVVTEGGENFSVGQRQLICLARALLRKTKILILDEATAAIDLETDDLIQATIRSEFQDCTVLTIAHRLNTILDSDRIVLLEHGEVVEHGAPKHLLAIEDSAFKAMVKDAGLNPISV